MMVVLRTLRRSGRRRDNEVHSFPHEMFIKPICIKRSEPRHLVCYRIGCPFATFATSREITHPSNFIGRALVTDFDL
jgi:hypothetical protein